MVMFIYRPEYYKDGVDEEGKPKGYTIIDIAKHRNGKLGEVELRFVGQYARFEELDQNFDTSSFTSISPNDQFDSPSRVYASKMNDDESMVHYPTITTDEKEQDPF